MGLGNEESSMSTTEVGFTGETFLLPVSNKDAKEVSGNAVFRSSFSFIGVVFETPREPELAHALAFAFSAAVGCERGRGNRGVGVGAASLNLDEIQAG